MTMMQIDMFPWYACAAYFAVSALRVKQTRVQENAAAQLLHMGALAAAFYLMFSQMSHMPVPFLRGRYMARSTGIEWIGFGVTCLGAAITIWSRYTLGSYWSGRVMLKVDHKLIRSGPYAYVRHPLYTGILTGLVGTALVVGEWRAIVAVALATAGFTFKARKEEVLLSSQFGDDYAEYRRQTGFLTPKMRAAA